MLIRFSVVFIFVLVNSLSLLAQLNLIPNGDFEYYTECPASSNSIDELSKAYPWFNPTSNTPDYYNVCDTFPERSGVPSNSYGFQYPRSGGGYAGVVVYYATKNGRDYLSVPLILPLEKSKFYQLGYYLNLSNQSSAASSSIGAFFSIDSIQADSTIQILNLTPQIQHATDSFLRDTLNWMKVSGTFVAQGGERFLTIGNFNDDAHTPLDTFYYVPNNWYSVYYYIDDVSLYEVKDTQSNHPFLQHENAFGNIGKPIEPLVIPTLLSANSDVNWQFINLKENTSLKLYNAIGQLEFSTANYQNNLQVSLLAAGIYFYEVQLEDEKMLKGKLVIIR